MRLLIGLVPALVLVAQTQPIPGQFPPTPIEPIPNLRSGPPFDVPVRLRAFAVLRHKVEARYTDEARAAGLQGTVTLYVEVNGEGSPSVVHVMEGLGLGLDEEAIKAVKQWEFEPGPVSPDNIQDILAVAVDFHLDRPGTWFVASEHYRFPAEVRERHGDIDRPAPTRYVAPAVECSEPKTASVPFVVGKDGTARVTGAIEDKGFAAAIEAWRFKPAERNGKTLEAQGTVDFECRAAGAEPSVPAMPLAGPVAAPVLARSSEPEYSERARRAELQGTSTLYLEVSREGKPVQIHVIKPLGMGLDQKAMEAVLHWRFTPGMKAGRPVTTAATIEVNFRLL